MEYERGKESHSDRIAMKYDLVDEVETDDRKGIGLKGHTRLKSAKGERKSKFVKRSVMNNGPSFLKKEKTKAKNKEESKKKERIRRE